MSRLNICFSSDDAYAQYLAAAMVSILRNTNREIRFYILTSFLSEENRNKLESLKSIGSFELEFLNINSEEFNNLPNKIAHLNLYTYYRFKIATLLSDLDKVLYLDCDIISIDDISKLYDINICEYYVAAAEDITSIPRKARLGTGNYINAGVLLLNLDLLRRDGVEDKLFQYAAQNKNKIELGDQDVINYVMAERIKLLPDIYNYQYATPLSLTNVTKPEYARKAPEGIVLLHYAGGKKPWNTTEVRWKYAKEYWANHALTPWGAHYRRPPRPLLLARELIWGFVRNFKYIVLRLLSLTGTETYLRKLQGRKQQI